MITGIENFDANIQKALLECIAHNFDMSDDIDVEEVDDYVIKINDVKYYIITDSQQQSKLSIYNSDMLDSFFDGLTKDQLAYIDEDRWYEDHGISTFEEWLQEETEWSVIDSDYYGRYNFYEVR